MNPVSSDETAKAITNEVSLNHPSTTDTTYTTVWELMSRTYRKQPTHVFRVPQTYSELKQQYFDSDGYDVSQHKRYIPTNYDDIRPTAYYQLDHQCPTKYN